MYKFKYSAWLQTWIVINKATLNIQSSWKNSLDASRVCADLNKNAGIVDYKINIRKKEK